MKFRLGSSRAKKDFIRYNCVLVIGQYFPSVALELAASASCLNVSGMKTPGPFSETW